MSELTLIVDAIDAMGGTANAARRSDGRELLALRSAYEAGLAFARYPSGKYAEGYTGAVIEGEPGTASAMALYSAYCAGYCEGSRSAR